MRAKRLAFGGNAVVDAGAVKFAKLLNALASDVDITTCTREAIKVHVLTKETYPILAICVSLLPAECSWTRSHNNV